MRLASPPRLLLAFIVLAAATPVQAQPNAEQLLDEMDKAFAAPAEPLKPSFLIFPVVGADDHVRYDGAGLSHMAMFAAVMTTRKHIDICVPFAQAVMRNAGCLKAKTALDAESIRLCLAALGTKLYAMPKLVRRDGADVLTIACHGDGDKYRDRTFTHTMDPNDTFKASGLIARDVQEFLGVSLRPEEIALAAQPQVRNNQDLRALFEIYYSDAGRGSNDKPIRDLLDRNPRCVLGWELYFTRAADRAASVRRFEEMKPPLECPRSRISYAVQIRDLGQAERALRMLLPLAPSYRTDSYFNTTLFKCSTLLSDPRLGYHVLELWRKADTSYSAHLARGERLVDWAWQARGADWAANVKEEGWQDFHGRLEEAKQELEKALKINPSGWAAHAPLIAVAKGLGLPREFMEDHFKKATKLRPRFNAVYSAKAQYLMPRWHGSVDELLEFGRQCLATGFWDEHIPQLFGWALRDCYTNPRDGSTNFELLQLPAVWDSVLAYQRGAEKGADGGWRNRVLNEVIDWGLRGGHLEDMVVPLQKLRGKDRIDSAIFPDVDELEFFYNRVHAKTGKLMTQLRSPGRNDLALAKAIVALAEGDWEEAARAIEQAKPGIPYDAERIATYRAAIALGRKLAKEKVLTLKGAEGLAMFPDARPVWQYGGDQFACTLRGGTRNTLLCPLGIRHGVISGTLSWSGIAYVQIVTHTRAARDKLTLVYQPERGNNGNPAQTGGTVDLVRNGRRLQRLNYPPGPLSFRIEYGAGQDSFVPASGPFGEATWEVEVDKDVASGFRIEAYGRDNRGTFAIHNLRIELKD
jgi:hypothetical protein